jgi:LmbE family N-acetylglucosaminyl deacetylase
MLGVNVEVVEHHTTEHCEQILRKVLPDIVITHRVDDVHDDHRAIAISAIRAIPGVVIDTGRPLRMYSCDTYESMTLHGLVEGRVIVDISDMFETKQRALSEHQSQPLDHFRAMAERLANSWGARIGVKWAEAFDPIPVLGRVPGRTHL